MDNVLLWSNFLTLVFSLFLFYSHTPPTAMSIASQDLTLRWPWSDGAPLSLECVLSFTFTSVCFLIIALCFSLSVLYVRLSPCY